MRDLENMYVIVWVTKTNVRAAFDFATPLIYDFVLQI